MNIMTVLLIVLIFGAIFYFAGQFTSGALKQVVQFLSGAIIVVALLLFLLGLFGYRAF